jgi:hypothetical protein
MKEIINQINQSIEEKSNRLKEKTERYFAAINIPSSSNTQQSRNIKTNGSVPPISYVLYGIAGLSTVGALASESKIMCLGVAVASAFGGYSISKKMGIKTTPVSRSSPNENIGFVKNEVISKVLDAVKKITEEWEEFMELKQREIQSVISTSSLNENEKDLLSSKVFIFEIIDISISEFSSMVNTSVSAIDIKQKLEVYKDKVVSAIDEAAAKQKDKYNSLNL